jgi:hypothetical protein
MVGSGRAIPSSPVLPWTYSAVTSAAFQRRVAAREDADVGPPRKLADDPRVLLGQRQRHVARHRGDAQNLDLLGLASARRIATASS